LGTTNVPLPGWGANGITLPAESDILAGVQNDWIAAIPGLVFKTAQGSQTNPTPQGQITASEAAIIGDCYAFMLWVFQQFDPALNSGRAQDAIGRVYFQTRIAGAPTVQPCLCTGLQNVQIPVGALAADQSGNLWICQQAGTIGASGNVTLDFAAAVDGPTPAPSQLTIYRAIFGWDTIAPSGNAVLGQNVETSAAFERRRALSTAGNSMGPADAILGAVLAVPGVLDAYVYDNDSATATTVGGVSINPNSVYACVFGGASQAVAQAIWSKKAPGCGYTGNTVVTVADPNPLYQPPAPTYTVVYQIPTVVPLAARVVCVNSSLVPSDALTQVQNAMIANVSGNQAGIPRAGIGQNILHTRFYPSLAALGSWAQIVIIQIGISGAAASFSGSIAGTTLTVSTVASGALAIGDLLQDTTGSLAPGTVITAGGGSSWTVSPPQTVAIENMTATTMAANVQMQINQEPSLAAANIYLALQ
jgi:hypothetical protein